MTCLLCGAKLAIFRKSSIGDFCTLEHRALYLAEHGSLPKERRSAKRSEATVEAAGDGRHNGRGYFDATQTATLAETQVSSPVKPSSTYVSAIPAMAVGHFGPKDSNGLTWTMPRAIPDVLPQRTTGLVASGLVLPWSGAATLGFSLASLVAAAWARSGNPVLTAGDEPLRIQLAVAFPEPGQIDINLPINKLQDEIGYRSTVQPQGSRTMPGSATSEPRPLAAVVAASAFDLPASKPEFFGRRTASDPIALRQAWPRPQGLTDENLGGGLRPVVPQTVVLPEARHAQLDLRESIQAISKAAAVRAAEARKLYEIEEFRVPRIPPRPAEDDWVHNLSKFVPSGQVWLAMAACAIFTLGAVTFLAIPKPVFSAAFQGNGVSGIRSLMRTRAAVRLNEDFRSGLSSWDGVEGWAKDWAYDPSGSLRPGKLGLWRKSMNLTNYKFEFLGQVEKKGLSWVFRASDAGNYHAAKIMISKPGPLPLADLIHYSVVDGVAGPRTTRSLPFSIRNDMMYQVQMDIAGNNFSTRINGRVVDSWIDSRHPSGGVGFFSEQGEQSRVSWLRVSNRDDFIGRICSYLTAERFVPTDETLASASLLIDGETVLLVQ